MRPLAGVVVDSDGRALLIALESGLTVQIQKRAGFGIGSKCWVSYDYTKQAVRHIYADDPTLGVKQDTTEDLETDGEHGDHTDIVESNGAGCSGALSPCSEGWEFWNSGSGVLSP